VSYVAEPYSFVAGQVLTALTGGVARETHQFFAAANSFSFERDPATINVDTLEVTGQAGQAFFAFQQGRDYRVTSDGHLVFLASDKSQPPQPAPQATWPDEGTEFYVSYYHNDSAKALLTDRNVGSLTRTLAESFARELAVLRKQLELVYQSGFVDTATGTALDMVVALFGLTRKKGDFSSGTVRFVRDTPAPADVFIPDGTRVSTAVNPPISFLTTIAKTLRRGQLAVEADVRSEISGPAGVVAAKVITVINQPILGINSVINDASTVLGGASESDAELRARAKKVAERVGKATPLAIVNALTEVDGLKENDVKLVEDLVLRPGVVQVFVAKDATPALASDVEDAILKSRAAGIRVEHNLSFLLPSAVAAPVSSGDARDSGASDAPPSSADFKLPISCDVVVFPNDPRLAGPDQANMKQSVQAAINNYVANSAIGGVLVYNQMIAQLMAIAGVADVVLTILAKGDAGGKGKRNLQVPAGRRATLDPADLTVSFAGAPVQFDFDLKVTVKGGSALADIQNEIKGKLADYFSTKPASVNSDDILKSLGASDLYTLAPADLSWTVELDQAGLLIHDQGGSGAATAINAGDVPVLRSLNVEVKS
jgi:uncharacterized phage protein gp47/JayE